MEMFDHIRTKIQEKNKLVVGFASVASVQAQHILLVQPSVFAASSARISSTQAPADLATTLLWLRSRNAGVKADAMVQVMNQMETKPEVSKSLTIAVRCGFPSGTIHKATDSGQCTEWTHIRARPANPL